MNDLENETSDVQWISNKLSQIQRLQEEALEKSTSELQHLRIQLEKKDEELREKDHFIDRLKRERLQSQEERAAELAGLVKRIANSSDNMSNPYQSQHSLFSGIFQSARTFSSASRSNDRQPLRLVDLLQIAMFVMIVGQLYNIAHLPRQMPVEDSVNSSPQANWYSMETEAIVKPWDSTPPTPIQWNGHYTHFVKRRHSCIQGIRDKHNSVFSTIMKIHGSNQEILLVDPAYHANVGDHMLTLGELHLIENTFQLPSPKQCHYIQAGGFYDVCTEVIQDSDPSAEKLAMWHAGGNWGDLWRDAQSVRIPSMKTILENGYNIVGMPQSLYYSDQMLKMEDATKIKEKIALGLGLATETFPHSVHEGEQRGWNDDLWTTPVSTVNTTILDTPHGLELAHSKVTLTWREKKSFDEASKLYPFVTNILVPDIAFQLGPYRPIRRNTEQLVDIVIFLRNDHESQVERYRDNESIRRMLPKDSMTFKIVDWSDRESIFDTKDSFFTDTAIELLSMGKVVVCDRLHAAILSYLSGIPFVFIDQVSGKISKTLSVAFEGIDDCNNGEAAMWSRAHSLKEALTKACEMIEERNLSHDELSFFQRLLPF